MSEELPEGVDRDRIIVACYDLALVLDDIHPGWDSVTVSKDGKGSYHVVIEKEKPPVETEGP